MDPSCSDAGCELFPNENAKVSRLKAAIDPASVLLDATTLCATCCCCQKGCCAAALPTSSQPTCHCLPLPHPTPLQAVGKFLDYALKQEAVRFVTYSDFIRWMQVGAVLYAVGCCCVLGLHRAGLRGGQGRLLRLHPLDAGGRAGLVPGLWLCSGSGMSARPCGWFPVVGALVSIPVVGFQWWVLW